VLYKDRISLLGTGAALGGGLSVMVATIPLGSTNAAIIILSLVHAGILFVHFQVKSHWISK
jgi:hypothetical protein